MKNKFLLSTFYFWWFSATCIISAFVPLFLKNTFSREQVGSLLGSYYAVGIIVPILGTVLIRKVKIKRLIIACFLTLGVLLLLLSTNLNYTTAWIIFCLCGFCVNLALPQVYYIASELSTNGNFSKIRLWGSIGFIMTSLILGYFFKEHLNLMPYIFSIVVFLSLLFFSFVDVSQLPIHDTKISYKISISEINFLLSSVMTMAGLGILLTYFSLFLNSHHYNQLEIGAIWSAGVFCEVLAFHFMPITFKKFNLNYILMMSYVASIIRFILTAIFVDNPYLVILIQGLNAFGFAWMHAAGIETIKKFLNPNLGQTLYFMLANGFGFWLGTFFGNLALKNFGFEMVFYLAAAFNFLAILFLFPNMAASSAKKSIFSS